MARHTELSHNEDIEWGVQFPRNFVSHGNSAPRKCKYQRIRPVFVGLEILRKDLAGVYSVPEIHSGLPCLFLIWTIALIIREYNVGSENSIADFGGFSSHAVQYGRAGRSIPDCCSPGLE